VAVIFLDLKKAFDSVCKQRLIKKLACLGMSDGAVSLLSSYLINRFQSVKDGDCFSKAMNIQYGVPQGSVLGPTLFNLYINDIHFFCHDLNIVQFADDTCIIVEARCRESLKKELEFALAKVNFWLRVNKLTLNTNKTKVLEINVRNTKSEPLNVKCHFCRYPNVISSVDCGIQDGGEMGAGGINGDPRLSFFSLASSTLNDSSVNCNCPTIDQVTHFKYLGLIFQQNLKWNLQSESLMKRIRAASILIYKMRNVCSTDFRRVIYNSYIHSQLKYGILLYGATMTSTIKPLIVLQKKCLRNVYKLSCRESTAQIWSKFKILHFYAIYIYSIVMHARKNNIEIGRSSTSTYATRFVKKSGFSHHLGRLVVNDALLSHRLVNVKLKVPQLFSFYQNESFISFKKRTKDILYCISVDDLPNIIYSKI